MVRTVTDIESFADLFAEHAARVRELGKEHDVMGTLNLKSLEFVDVDFGVPEIPGADFTGSSFVRALVGRLFAPSCTWVSGRAVDTNFAKANFSHSKFEDLTLDHCSLMRTELSYSSLRKVRFVGCDFTKTSFRHSNLSQVVFESCRFERTFFANATFDQVAILGLSVVDRVQSLESIQVARLADKQEDPVAVLTRLENLS